LDVVISHCLANLRKSHFRVAPTITTQGWRCWLVQGGRPYEEEKGGSGS